VQKINTGKALSFLEEAYHKSHDSETGLVIAQAIYDYGPEGRRLFESMKENAPESSKLIFKHIENPLIKSVYN
jgi:hypothetical protein